MNCFNGEKYLCEAIDSVIAQTYQNWEIVFWDNQSTDRSAEIVRSYQDPRIAYYYAPTHTWLYEARNYAMEQARGDLIAFLDVDDRWLPAKLEQQIPLFADPEVGFVCGDCWVEDERQHKRWRSHKGRVPTGWVLDDLLANYYVGLLTLVLRRTAVASLDYPCDPRYHVIGDLDLVIRLALGWKLDCIQEPVAVYRLHGANETAKHANRLVGELETWWREMREVDAIGRSPSARLLVGRIAYLRGLALVAAGEKSAARALLSDIPSRKQRLKLWSALLLPAAILRRSKSQLF
jgi:glycosyltransferase involved in cell wall biosynthesis